MQVATSSSQRFIRRTMLHNGEYRKNFRQIDRDAIEVVTSDEACQVTSLMSKVYLRLINAPPHLSEREGVLRFTGEERAGEWQTAWQQLVSMLGVESATARKALGWMHEQGVIGYDAHRNGVGIRVFINRAAASISKGVERAAQKNLPAARTSLAALHTSPGDTPFKDTFGVQDNLDLSLNPCAPKSGAGPRPTLTSSSCRSADSAGYKTPSGTSQRAAPAAPIEQIVERLKRELEPCVQISATRAATQAAAREHERTRGWLDKCGIPKATRVAQKEAFDLLRSFGVIDTERDRARRAAQVGLDHRAGDSAPAAPAARPLTLDEIAEAAELCVTLYEAQGKGIDDTLAGIASAAGGWVLTEDVPRVRTAARSLLRAKGSAGHESVTQSPPA